MVSVIGDIDVAAAVDSHSIGIIEAAAHSGHAARIRAPGGHFRHHRRVCVVDDISITVAVHSNSHGAAEAAAQRNLRRGAEDCLRSRARAVEIIGAQHVATFIGDDQRSGAQAWRLGRKGHLDGAALRSRIRGSRAGAAHDPKVARVRALRGRVEAVCNDCAHKVHGQRDRGSRRAHGVSAQVVGRSAAGPHLRVVAAATVREAIDPSGLIDHQRPDSGDGLVNGLVIRAAAERHQQVNCAIGAVGPRVAEAAVDHPDVPCRIHGSGRRTAPAAADC